MTDRGTRRAEWAWVFYDWANSAFSLSAMALFFPVFFKEYWCADVDDTVSTARLGFGHALIGLTVAVLSPLLGALGDLRMGRKRPLIGFMLLGAGATAGLFLMGEGAWLSALALFLIGRLGFAFANLFYDSLLTDVASPEQMDRVSSKGYAFGYLGCGLLGVLNTAMVLRPGWFGIPSGSMAVRIVFLTVGVWWIGFTVPLMLWVAERRGRVRRRGGILSASFGEAFRTARMIASQRHVLIFLIAFWLYNDGVHAFVMMSADFGMAIGIPASRLALALLAVQFVAFPAALLFGNLARHVGAKNVLLIAVAIYMIVSVVGAMALRTWVQFLVLACVVGCAQGAIQALSRSYYASMVPGDRAAEYFGFYSLVGKFSVVLGPAIVGGMSLFGKRIGLESVTAVRTGIAALGVLFIAGGLLLWRAPTRPAPVEAQCG